MSTATTPLFKTVQDLVTYGDDLPPEIDQRCLDAIDSAAEENGSTILFIGSALHEIETILRESTDPELVDTDDYTQWLDCWLEQWNIYIREECMGDGDDDDDQPRDGEQDNEGTKWLCKACFNEFCPPGEKPQWYPTCAKVRECAECDAQTDCIPCQNDENEDEDEDGPTPGRFLFRKYS